MMSLLLILGAVITVFASIGRATTPCQERIPLSQWTPADLHWNFRHGLYACSHQSALNQFMNDRT
ncbi:hypothetical protein [Arthrobacter sp. Ld5]|uniref:hypothetical protein n=1 Tax=Arthrobacter sp. Ld5 TaxID=649152 RepID=UPI003EB8A54C